MLPQYWAKKETMLAGKGSDHNLQKVLFKPSSEIEHTTPASLNSQSRCFLGELHKDLPKEHLDLQRPGKRHCGHINFLESELLVFVTVNRFELLCFKGRNHRRFTLSARSAETVLSRSNKDFQTMFVKKHFMLENKTVNLLPKFLCVSHCKGQFYLQNLE